MQIRASEIGKILPISYAIYAAQKLYSLCSNYAQYFLLNSHALPIY